MDSRNVYKIFVAMVQPSILLLVLVQVVLSAPESDLVKLPGQPVENVGFKQYAGYITVDQHNGRALFYYFVEVETDPTSRPLTLWFNGGPGCSSLGYGAFMENGPFRPKGSVLEQNIYSWNKETNMLYVESPIGVGFSYSNSSLDYKYQNDTLAAEDNLEFILNWYTKFPEFRGVDFYITGESYGGHYVPQLASLILDYNKRPNITPIKLKGIAIGNAFLDIEMSINNGEFLWSHGLISDEVYQLYQNVCNTSRMWTELFVIGRESQDCINVYNRINAEVGVVDSYDVISEICLADHALQTTTFGKLGKLGKLQKKILQQFNGIDLCISYEIDSYFNRVDVQKSLHANTTGLSYPWGMCQGSTLYYDQSNRAISIIPVLSDLLKVGLQIMLYSGDQDSVVPFTATRTIVNNLANQLKLHTIIPYRTWYDKKQVAGWTQVYGYPQEGSMKNQTLLTFATVRGAAHEVPYTSPSQALTLFKAFIRGLSLPSK